MAAGSERDPRKRKRDKRETAQEAKVRHAEKRMRKAVHDKLKEIFKPEYKKRQPLRS